MPIDMLHTFQKRIDGLARYPIGKYQQTESRQHSVSGLKVVFLRECAEGENLSSFDRISFDARNLGLQLSTNQPRVWVSFRMTVSVFIETLIASIRAYRQKDRICRAFGRCMQQRFRAFSVYRGTPATDTRKLRCHSEHGSDYRFINASAAQRRYCAALSSAWAA